MSVPESFPLARFLAERAPSSDSRLARRVAGLPPRLLVAVDAAASANEARDEMSPPESPGSEGTSMLMSGNASLPALRRSSVGSLKSQASRSSWSIDTPGPVENGVPLLPLAPNAQLQAAGDQFLEREPAPAVLECPFIDLHCHQRFNNFNRWREHSLAHFKDALPPSNSRCVFCWQIFHSEVGIESWSDKLVCTAEHHVREGLILEHAHPDFALHRYLWEKGCITRAEWKGLGELRTEIQRRGNLQRQVALGSAGPSPPNSPQDKDSREDQDRVVMTTNRRRDRDRERRAREIRRLQETVDAFGED